MKKLKFLISSAAFLSLASFSLFNASISEATVPKGIEVLNPISVESYQEQLRTLRKDFAKKSDLPGYADKYQLTTYDKDTFYGYLYEKAEKVSMFSEFSNIVYNIYELGINFTNPQEVEQKLQSARYGYKVVGILKRYDGQFSGVVLYNTSKNVALVVFAGTASGTDLVEDFKFTAYGEETVYGIGRGLSIHSGFMKALIDGMDSFKDEMDKLIINYDPNHPSHNGKKLKIIFMGHSLGGAVSTLAAYHAKTEILPYANAKLNPDLNPRDVLVYNITFASPRVFDKASAKIVDQKLNERNIIRFWNDTDIVPTLPMEALNSLHVGLDFKIPDTRLRIATPIVGWHSMERYHEKSSKVFEEIITQAEERKGFENAIKGLEERILKMGGSIEEAPKKKGFFW